MGQHTRAFSRVSVGSALSRAALGATLFSRASGARAGRAAREMQEQGTFGFAEDAVKYAELNKMFS